MNPKNLSDEELAEQLAALQDETRRRFEAEHKDREKAYKSLSKLPYLQQLRPLRVKVPLTVTVLVNWNLDTDQPNLPMNPLISVESDIEALVKRAVWARAKRHFASAMKTFLAHVKKHDMELYTAVNYVPETPVNVPFSSFTRKPK